VLGEVWISLAASLATRLDQLRLELSDSSLTAAADADPVPVGSRLLYVVLTRARHKTSCSCSTTASLRWSRRWPIWRLPGHLVWLRAAFSPDEAARMRRRVWDRLPVRVMSLKTTRPAGRRRR
jgi:hypothetical protein